MVNLPAEIYLGNKTLQVLIQTGHLAPSRPESNKAIVAYSEKPPASSITPFGSYCDWIVLSLAALVGPYSWSPV
jgi:hypothetical protein